MWREVGCLGMGMLSSFGFVALLHHRACCWTLPSRGARGDAKLRSLGFAPGA